VYYTLRQTIKADHQLKLTLGNSEISAKGSIYTVPEEFLCDKTQVQLHAESSSFPTALQLLFPQLSLNAKLSSDFQVFMPMARIWLGNKASYYEKYEKELSALAGEKAINIKKIYKGEELESLLNDLQAGEYILAPSLISFGPDLQTIQMVKSVSEAKGAKLISASSPTVSREIILPKVYRKISDLDHQITTNNEGLKASLTGLMEIVKLFTDKTILVQNGPAISDDRRLYLHLAQDNEAVLELISSLFESNILKEKVEGDLITVYLGGENIDPAPLYQNFMKHIAPYINHTIEPETMKQLLENKAPRLGKFLRYMAHRFNLTLSFSKSLITSAHLNFNILPESFGHAEFPQLYLSVNVSIHRADKNPVAPMSSDKDAIHMDSIYALIRNAKSIIGPRFHKSK
jgi:hypothetical protein